MVLELYFWHFQCNYPHFNNTWLNIPKNIGHLIFKGTAVERQILVINWMSEGQLWRIAWTTFSSWKNQFLFILVHIDFNQSDIWKLCCLVYCSQIVYLQNKLIQHAGFDNRRLYVTKFWTNMTSEENCPEKKSRFSVVTVVSKLLNKLVFINWTYFMLNLPSIRCRPLVSFYEITIS